MGCILIHFFHSLVKGGMTCLDWALWSKTIYNSMPILKFNCSEGKKYSLFHFLVLSSTGTTHYSYDEHPFCYMYRFALSPRLTTLIYIVTSALTSVHL